MFIDRFALSGPAGSDLFKQLMVRSWMQTAWLSKSWTGLCSWQRSVLAFYWLLQQFRWPTCTERRGPPNLCKLVVWQQGLQS